MRSAQTVRRQAEWAKGFCETSGDSTFAIQPFHRYVRTVLEIVVRKATAKLLDKAGELDH
jgi:hypothetical protein